MTYDGYAIFMPYGWCRGETLKVRKRTLRLSAGVVCCAPPIIKPSLGRTEKLAQRVRRREIYSPVPTPSLGLTLFYK